MAVINVQSLHYYPVKSLQGIDSQALEIEAFGPKMDRRFMLVDEDGKFVTQRAFPGLSQVASEISVNQSLVITLPGAKALNYLIKDFSENVDCIVWSDEVKLKVTSDSQNDTLISDWLGKSVKLAYMSEDCFRQVDREYFSEDQRVSLADGFPLLLANQASLDDLNSRLESPVGMNRFRPNLVVNGDIPFQEDEWKRIRVGEVEFAVVKPCSRCVMTTIDESGKKGREPLKTLSTYRKNEFGICFGQNLVPLNYGTLHEGDVLEVIS